MKKKEPPVELTLVFQAMVEGEDRAKQFMQDVGEAFQAICERHGVELEDGSTGGALLRKPRLPEPEVGPDYKKEPWKNNGDPRLN